MTMMAPQKDFKKYTMGFKDKITEVQRANLERIAGELARSHEVPAEDISVSYIEHTNTFVFETTSQALFDTACLAYNKLEETLSQLQEEGAKISTAKIKRAAVDRIESAAVTYLKQVTLNENATEKPKFMEFLTRASKYYLGRLNRPEHDLAIEIKDNVIQIRSTSVPDGDILEIIFRDIANDPTLPIIDNQGLSRIYTRSRSAYTAETKALKRNPDAKPLTVSVRNKLPISFEEVQFNGNDIPGLKHLKPAFNASVKKGMPTDGYLLDAFGNARIISNPGEQFLRVTLPVFLEPERTELVKAQIVKGLNKLAHLAQIGQLRRATPQKVAEVFMDANKESIKSVASSTVPLNKALTSKIKIPAKTEPTHFTLPRIDVNNQLIFGETHKEKLSGSEIAFMKAMNDKTVVMSMSTLPEIDKDKKPYKENKIRGTVYQALEGLRRKKYQKIIIAGDTDHFHHARDVVEEIDRILGHNDVTKGRLIRDKLSNEGRIDITDTLLLDGPECRQTFILLNGAQDCSYPQLVEVINKLPGSGGTTIAMMGRDEKYNDLLYASDYKFFYDTLTQDSRYSKLVIGFMPEEQQRTKHELVQTMKMNGHDKPPHILSQRQTLNPSPEQK